MMGITANTEKKNFHSGIRLKITGIAAVFALLAVITLLIINITSMEALNLEIAVLMGEDRLKIHMVHFISMLEAAHGELRLQNGELTDEQGISLANNYDIIDPLSRDLEMETAILVKENNDYRRIATSIVDPNGKRVVDTFLGSDSAAYAPIQSGKEYIGKVDILGKDYLGACRT